MTQQGPVGQDGDRIQVIVAGVEQVDLVASLFDAYRQFYHQPPDLAAMFGFAPRPTRSPAGPLGLSGTASADCCACGRGVADRPGPGAGRGGAGPEQDAAEQPPRG